MQNFFETVKYHLQGIKEDPLGYFYDYYNVVKWWFLHRFVPRYRFHVHKYHRLKPGWHDVDYRMLNACFDLLVEFVEREKGLDNLKYQYEYLETDGKFDTAKAEENYTTVKEYEENKALYQEVKELYEWWVSHPEEKINDFYFFNENVDICTENFLRLVKVRRYLWT